MLDLMKLRARVEAVKFDGSDDALTERRFISRLVHDYLVPEPKVVFEPDYCSDFDATRLLCEHLLPAHEGFSASSPPSSGWKIGVYRGMTPTGAPHARWEAMLRAHGSQAGYEHSGATAAAALLSAFLSACADPAIAARMHFPSTAPTPGDRE